MSTSIVIDFSLILGVTVMRGVSPPIALIDHGLDPTQRLPRPRYALWLPTLTCVSVLAAASVPFSACFGTLVLNVPFLQL